VLLIEVGEIQEAIFEEKSSGFFLHKKSSQVKFLLPKQIQNSPPLVPGAGSLRRRQNLNQDFFYTKKGDFSSQVNTNRIIFVSPTGGNGSILVMSISQFFRVSNQ